MTSFDGNIFRVTGLLCGEFTGHRWIPCTKGQWRGVLMFSFVWNNNWVNNGDVGGLGRHRAHYGVIVMRSSINPGRWPYPDGRMGLVTQNIMFGFRAGFRGNSLIHRLNNKIHMQRNPAVLWIKTIMLLIDKIYTLKTELMKTCFSRDWSQTVETMVRDWISCPRMRCLLSP